MSDEEKAAYDPELLYLGGASALTEKMMVRGNLPIRKRIQMRKNSLVAEIANLDKLLKVLDENPGIETFQDLVQRSGL